MLITEDIKKPDKIILNNLGKNADISMDELLTHTKYRAKSSLYNRIQNLRNKKYLYGPYFDINYNAIGKNKLYSIFAFLQYTPEYKYAVLDAMRKIDCHTMIYPVRTAEIYIGIYRCNNWNFIAQLFKMLKTWGWIKEYSIQKSEYRWIIQNPDFFGEFIPPHKYQVPQGDLPHFQYDNKNHPIEITSIDLIVLKYLSVKPYNLTQIKDVEFSSNNITLKYHDLKRSYKKLKKNKILLEKNFFIFPLPLNLCSLFFFVSKGKNFSSHLKMISHYGEDLRLNKTLIVVGNKVISYFVAHPLFEEKILGITENKVDYANVYGVRTYPSSELSRKSFNDDYFDFDSQKWIFPYSEYEEKLKTLKEKKERRETRV